jgi:hypothetical protein
MIRLVCLDTSGTWQLHAFHRQSLPPFQALSYTWGSDLQKKPLLLDYETFSVSKSLWAFLSSSHVGLGWWWIDQICIDQQDEEERNAQVSIMAQIFNQASAVVVWLDDITETTCQTFAVEIASISHGSWNSAVPHSHRSSLVDQAVSEFFDHRYWSRIWIIQELMYANEVHVTFGANRVTMRDLELLMEERVNWGQGIPGGHGPWLIERATALSKDVPHQLWRLDDLVHSLDDTSCTDQRDIIYGIQGILEPHFRQEVDYSKTCHEVFIDAVHVLIQHWPDAKPTTELLTICLKLGHQMIPERLALYTLVNPEYVSVLDAVMMVVKVDTADQQRGQFDKTRIVDIFRPLE